MSQSTAESRIMPRSGLNHLAAIVTSFFITMLAGCVGPSVHQPRLGTGQVLDCCVAGPTAAQQDAVVRTAARLIGARTIKSNGRRISYDCAGVTRAIYLAHGIDLYRGNHPNPGANGVRLIYDHVRQHGRLHQGPTVRRGDLIFFDNTWDVNGDGLVNDPLTHVGVVERIEDDGTVVFISRVAEAIERYRINLRQPHVHRANDGRILNDHMRRKHRRDGHGTAYLTGELFAGFGTRITP
jgi:hypothetical protein